MTNITKQYLERVTGVSADDVTESVWDALLEYGPSTYSDLLALVGTNVAQAKILDQYLRDIALAVSTQLMSVIMKTLTQYGLTQAQYDRLLEVPIFAQYVGEELDKVAGLDPAERAQRVAQMMLPSAMASMSAILADTRATNTDRVRAFKELVAASGITKTETDSGGGVQVNVQFNGSTAMPGSPFTAADVLTHDE